MFWNLEFILSNFVTCRALSIQSQHIRPYPTTPIFKPTKNYQALHSIIKPSYETKQDKGFQKKKKKDIRERNRKWERPIPNYSYQRSIATKGKKNSIIERDIKILPYLINRGGVGAGRRKSQGFDERERETETRGIREKNGPERRTSLGFGILCGL